MPNFTGDQTYIHTIIIDIKADISWLSYRYSRDMILTSYWYFINSHQYHIDIIWYLLGRGWLTNTMSYCYILLLSILPDPLALLCRTMMEVLQRWWLIVGANATEMMKTKMEGPTFLMMIMLTDIVCRTLLGQYRTLLSARLVSGYWLA